jgi:hypothetical protein
VHQLTLLFTFLHAGHHAVIHAASLTFVAPCLCNMLLPLQVPTLDEQCSTLNALLGQQCSCRSASPSIQNKCQRLVTTG